MDNRLQPLDAATYRVPNDHAVEALLFAGPGVTVETNALQEFLDFLAVQTFIRQAAAHGFLPAESGIERAALTPDFHKGAGIPIGTVLATRGFVLPAAIGNDINCGMRLHATSLKASAVQSRLDALEGHLRHSYFEGGRNIPMTRLQREALFRHGLPGLAEAVPPSQTEGIWAAFHRHRNDLPRVEGGGALQAQRTPGLDDFLGKMTGLSRDNQIGSIGGGNHFVELQVVRRIHDPKTARLWGLREGHVALMVHSGSVAIGHLAGRIARAELERIHPPGLKRPPAFALPLDADSPALDAIHNAANFAFANRMFLALIALNELRAACGAFDAHLVYDAPHNMAWKESSDRVIHRKGACPARGPMDMAGTSYAQTGEPVLLPGSMGAPSYVLAGLGKPESLKSASHGAGRALSRGDALKAEDGPFHEFLSKFRVVTPVDFKRQDIRQRRDIVAKKLEDIKKEAPHAYKDIGAVMRTLTVTGMARPVAEFWPLMTVKG